MASKAIDPTTSRLMLSIFLPKNHCKDKGISGEW
jgi:hypothetical protein